MNNPDPQHNREQPPSLVAPCHSLGAGDPLRWLVLGWQDMRAAPLQSLCFGLLVVIFSAALSLGAWWTGGFWVLIGLLSAFVFAGPVPAIGFYTVSQSLEEGEPPSLHASWSRLRRSLAGTALFANLILVVMLLWARAATMVHVFVPQTSDASIPDFATYLIVGTLVGTFFCAIIFVVSVFALPMLHDRNVDAVTAAITSIHAVLRNKAAMLVWAMIIIAAITIGFATALLGLAILLPWIAYATWHGYRDTVDSSAWAARGAR